VTGALVVVAVALSVLAAAQLAMLAALWRAFGRAEETLRQMAAAADEFGKAARQFGELAGTTRNAAESLLGVFALGRLIPRAGGSLGAVKSGLDLAAGLLRLLRLLRGRRGAGGKGGPGPQG
jgi:hypothetical protein